MRNTMFGIMLLECLALSSLNHLCCWLEGLRAGRVSRCRDLDLLMDVSRALSHNPRSSKVLAAFETVMHSWFTATGAI